MTKALKNTMLRVIKRRLADGEDIDEILEDYPKLTDEDKAELKKELEIE